MLGGHSNCDGVLKSFYFELKEQFHVHFSTLDCKIKLFISQTVEVPVLGNLEL